MAREKRESDELYNMRRRAKRALQRAERQAKQASGAERAAIKNYINDVKKDIENSYVAKKGSSERRSVSNAYKEAQKAVKKTQAIENGNTSDSEFTMTDRAFRRELTKATKGESSIIAPNKQRARMYTKIFYASTQYLWEDVEPEERLSAIVQGLGVDSLYEAFRKTLADNRRALQEARQIDYTIPDNPNEDVGSPALLGLLEVFYR